MEKLVKDIVADGVVDAQEVKEIQEAFYADGKIDKDEADAMFAINDAVSGNANDESYKDLFVKVISDYVLEDDETPGVIDADESAYLLSKIQGDGVVDDVEKALLAHLKAKAISIESEKLKSFIEANS